jgi:CRISPR/Cas system-associated endonuclease Cas1
MLLRSAMDLLINTYGTRIRRSGERIVLWFPRTNTKREFAARRVEKIIILRPSSISTGAVQLALDHDIDIVYPCTSRPQKGRCATPYGSIRFKYCPV